MRADVDGAIVRASKIVTLIDATRVLARTVRAASHPECHMTNRHQIDESADTLELRKLSSASTDDEDDRNTLATPQELEQLLRNEHQG